MFDFDHLSFLLLYKNEVMLINFHVINYGYLEFCNSIIRDREWKPKINLHMLVVRIFGDLH